MEIIKLNLIPSGVNSICHCSQYDNGRVIRLELFDGLTPYTLQSGDTVTLNVRKPDNTIITASVTATQGNNYVDIVTTEQMCAVVGNNLCDLTITNGSTVIGTLNFYMQIERDVLADGIASQSVIEDLDALVQEAVGDNYYTKTEIDTDLDTIDNQIIDLSYNIKNKLDAKGIKEGTYYSTDWENGSITNDGIDFADSKFIRSKGYCYFGDCESITVKIQSGYSFGVRWYSYNPDNDTYTFVGSNYSTNVTEYNITDTSYYYRFVIKDANGNTASLEWGIKISFETTPLNSLVTPALSSLISGAMQTSSYLGENKNLNWEVGTIAYTGLDSPSNYFIRTNGYIKFDDVAVLHITPNTNYKWKYHVYTKSGDTYTNVYNTSMSSIEETIQINPEYYYRFVIGTESGSVIANIDTFSENVPIFAYPTNENVLNGDEIILSPDYEVISLPFNSEYQNFCEMDNYILFATSASAWGGTANGKIFVVSKTDYSLVKTLNHNLGHISQLNYDSENDLLLLANTESSSSPTLWIIHSASDILSINDGGDVLVANLSIDTIYLDGLESLYGSFSYAIGCWYGRVRTGEKYIIVNGNNNTKWALILLGKNNNELDSGTYQSTNNGFNGTYKIMWYKICPFMDIMKIIGVNDSAVCQGMTEYKGKIFTQVSHSLVTGGIFTPQIKDTMSRDIIYTPWVDDNGNQLGLSSGWYGEGCAVIDNNLYFGITQNKLLKIKI